MYRKLMMAPIVVAYWFSRLTQYVQCSPFTHFFVLSYVLFQLGLLLFSSFLFDNDEVKA
jgi:hypothetical protein